MGEVFRAHDPALNRDVAIKVISAGLDADETVRKRFRREAEAAAKLMHPNIITVYELGLEGEQLFMAMELLDGIDLKHALTGRKMSLDEKLGVMEQICEGLAFAHGHEIVHRDLKPANIHILPSGKVKIMDFGLARFGGSEMTTTGMVMGTPHYMSPEQVRGAKADARSDVFALGCVLYEMLTGRKPFDAESMHAVLYKIMQEEPVPLREAAPGTPETLVQVVERSLAKNPAERFENAGEMLAGIRQARQAVAAGKGHERVPGLERSPAGPVAREAVRPPARERSHASGGAPRHRAALDRGGKPVAAPRRPRARPRGGVGRRLGIAGVRAQPAGRAGLHARRGQPARAAGDRLAGRARSPQARSRRAGRRRASGGGRPETRRAATWRRGRSWTRPPPRSSGSTRPWARSARPAWTANVSRARPST